MGEQNKEIEQEKETIDYFAYGSNLLTARIQIGIPSARDPRVGRLDGYRFDFQGSSSRWNGATANIVTEDSSVVLGVVWRINVSDVANLDAQEVKYRPITVNVRVGDSTVICRTYVQIENGGSTKPSLAYKTVVLKGAIEHNLDAEYIEKLRRFPDNGVNQCGQSSLSSLVHE
ncbi:gamma-glutamylcyclotransferase-like protein [Leptotrombidium deliense]|uniref:gamma-glutamylcyclotransferase n=1 Tax=Leptotrombidium deliense TaxID=299467 RepID=A0A443SKM6_9ACAR|nr:gamma-glutamylcyclotransferase-like protein [Leptotrombidium deliense]